MLRCCPEVPRHGNPVGREVEMALQKVPTVAEALELAVQRVRANDYRAGRTILAWVLQHQPENVVAWLWMARCILTHEERAVCMQRVAALDPFGRASR